MSRHQGEAGFTLVEMLVAMGLFAAVSVGFYSVMFSVSAGSDTTTSVAGVSQEARLGFNRMVRDTREGEIVSAVQSRSYSVDIDFNGNGTIEPTPSEPSGDYERVKFQFNPASNRRGTVTLNGEVLMRGVDCLRDGSGNCRQPVFSYSSGRLEYDSDNNGSVSATELDQAPGIGNNNGALDGDELGFISEVTIALQVTEDDATSEFLTQVQLRNQR